MTRTVRVSRAAPLVTADWAKENVGNARVRFIEVDVDTTLYADGHIPGAVAWNWSSQLQDPMRRDVVSQTDLEALLGASGASPWGGGSGQPDVPDAAVLEG